MLLRPEERTKLDDSDDSLFYSIPRFVTHVDQGFIQQLTQLYRDRLQPNSRILDLMSSHISHLPQEIEFAHVEGHGMNQEELARNQRFNRYFTQDLNKNPQLPLADEDFDAVLICVSVQYLQYPDAIFSEIHRILKPGGIAIISFSNRMFYQKAIAAWRDGTEASRVALVKGYFKSVAGFTPPEVITHSSSIPSFLQILRISGGDPFYAIISNRSS